MSDQPTPSTPHQEEEFRESQLSSEMNVAQVHGSILRERVEPRDGYEPVPIWMIALFMGLVFWAGLYLAYNSGGFRADVFNAQNVSWTGGGAAADAGPPDPMVIGKRVYTQNCVACHQASGMGVDGQFPPLVGSEWVTSQDWHGDNHLIKILLHGLQGAVQVQGKTYNNAMPPWNQLKDEQIAAVLTYIRNEWGNQALPISADRVKQLREQTADRREPYTQSELKAVPREVYSPDDAAAAPAEAAPPEGNPAEGAAATPEA